MKSRRDPYFWFAVASTFAAVTAIAATLAVLVVLIRTCL